MASKTLLISSFTLLIMILLSLLSNYSVLADSNGETKSSPFGFIERLKGCHKGDKVKGIRELKKYMEMFGYLNYTNSTNQAHAQDDAFDESLRSAIKMYQINFNLNVTGGLDSQTVEKMTTPRCGLPDVVNGTTRMRFGIKTQQHHHGFGHFHAVSHYSFFPGYPTWPKYQLTYAFRPGTRSDAIVPVRRAFQTWAANTPFRFSEVQDYTNADIKIGFESRDHGDGSPFDGRGGILAHAFAPTDGRFHYDADESWSVGAVPGATDLQTVALHEIGHNLGLGHSSVPGAIMYPTIPSGTTKGLNEDDVQGMRALYRY